MCRDMRPRQTGVIHLRKGLSELLDSGVDAIVLESDGLHRPSEDLNRHFGLFDLDPVVLERDICPVFRRSHRGEREMELVGCDGFLDFLAGEPTVNIGRIEERPEDPEGTLHSSCPLKIMVAVRHVCPELR